MDPQYNNYGPGFDVATSVAEGAARAELPSAVASLVHRRPRSPRAARLIRIHSAVRLLPVAAPVGIAGRARSSARPVAGPVTATRVAGRAGIDTIGRWRIRTPFEG